MRFLHTADWHVGKLLRGRSRSDEHEKALDQILDIATREKVDCVLVGGDLFDSQAPAPDPERLIYNFFAEMVGKGIPAVAIGGNHDHPKRLAALRHLLECLKIYICPEPAPPGSGGIIDFAVDGESAKIAVLPFVSQRRIVDACRLMLPETSWYTEYAETVSQICAHLTASFSKQTVNLLLAHLYIYGAETSGSEREIHVSQPYAITPQRLPGNAHYVALGHLHRPQEVQAPSPTFYSGSPLQLDFGERGQEKRVVVVDAKPGKPAKTQSIPITAGRKLQEVAGRLEELKARTNELGSDFLRVTVKTDAPVPGIADRVREIFPNAVDVQIDYPRLPEETERKRLGKLTPQAMFAEFYRAQHGIKVPQNIGEMFRQLYEEICSATD